MPSQSGADSRKGAVSRLRAVVRGQNERRLRALWRVLLAAPLILVTGAVAKAVAAALDLSGWVPVGLLQATAFGLILLAWARFVDRRPVSGYGLSASRRWVDDVAVAFGAIVVSQSLWHALGSALGWTSVRVTGSASGPFLLAFSAAFLGIGLNVWVQETAFFGLVLRNAAEGLHARTVPASHAVLGAWVVGAVYVAAIHQGTLQRPGLFVAGAFFGLLYVHTGSLALPVGFHLGVNYTGGWVFAPAAVVGERATVFAVGESHALFSALSGPGIPQMVIGYLLVVGWLRLRGEPVGIVEEIARWTPR